MKNIYKEIEQGAQSEAALAELKSRFDIIESSLHDMWANTKAGEKDAREDAWLQLNALKQLRQSFKVDIDTAKLAQEQLRREETRINKDK